MRLVSSKWKWYMVAAHVVTTARTVWDCTRGSVQIPVALSVRSADICQMSSPRHVTFVRREPIVPTRACAAPRNVRQELIHLPQAPRPALHAANVLPASTHLPRVLLPALHVQ